jgi:hypothetical protein
MNLTEDVATAIADIRATFHMATVAVEEDGQGGAWVVVDPVPSGSSYLQPTTWIGFQIGYLSPATDVYPLFVRPDLARRDGAALGESFSTGVWGPRAEPAVQVSRRNNRHDPNIDTPVMKVLKVIDWVGSR